MVLAAAIVLYLLYLYYRERLANYMYILVFTVGSAVFFYSIDYVFNNVLEAHQKIRIEVLLGITDDPAGAGYNVNQSKIERFPERYSNKVEICTGAGYRLHLLYSG